MAFGTWWRGDHLPELAPLSNISICVSTDSQLIARLAEISLPEIAARFQAGNKLYLAYLDGLPVAYGWVAMREGSIDGLHLFFTIPAGNCYLWDFKTLPAWRGRGIYPHFLQLIIQQEQALDRFWIGYVPGNTPAFRAISKAGFQFLADMTITSGRASGLLLLTASDRSQACSAFFNLPIVSE